MQVPGWLDSFPAATAVGALVDIEGHMRGKRCYRGMTYRGMLTPMKVDKLSVSFPGDLGDEIRAAAERSGRSLSAWLGEAARARLRGEALRSALEDYQTGHGAFTPEELAVAERELGLAVGRSSDAA